MLRWVVFVLLIAFSPAAQAACAGENLFDKLDAQTRIALRVKADAAPFARGLVWRATRGDDVLTLLGTYHFDDPRHEALRDTIAPILQDAALLLVEAGPEEEAALIAEMTRNPAVMFETGATLPERMEEDDWKRLSAATAERGIPGFLAAKMKPWYVAMTLSMSPCAMAEVAQGVKGLDGQVIALAQAQGVPIRPLEPYDTVLGLFEQIPDEEQIDMIVAALATAEKADDYTRTLADAYFDEEARLIWEFTRHETEAYSGLSEEEVAAQMEFTEQLLMTDRNEAWIPVIETALESGQVVLAAGALHLPGTTGLLALLQDRGFMIERLPVAKP